MQEKVYTPKEIRELPKSVSVMPPCIANLLSGRTAVYTGSQPRWLKITDDVTLDDVMSAWEKWQPAKSAEQKELETKETQSWEITSSNGKSKYTVVLHYGLFSCTCVGFGFHRRCKHIDKAKAILNG